MIGFRAFSKFAALLVGVILVAISVFGLIARDGGDGAARDHATAQKIEVPSATIDLEALPPLTELPTTTTTTAAPVPALTPLSIRIPEVDIESPLIPLGLNPDNTLEVPTDFALAGWYIYRPVPGELGPSVIAGHVDSKTGPAVFYRLNELEPGAVIEVDRSDGTVAVFKVTAKEQHDKDEFPTEHVYGPTSSAQLRVITCGGSFDRSIGHYNDNVIVFAELAGIRPAR